MIGEMTKKMPIGLPERYEEVSQARPSLFGQFHLCSDYSFDSYVSGQCNRMAYAACKAVVDGHAKLYNPLFLYGGVGLGKTHLLQSVVRALLEKNPDSRVCYLSCEAFLNEFVRAVEQGNLCGLRDKYASVDTLVIDDVQFLRENEKSQSEFFQVFNSVYERQGQIVLSADSSPTEMEQLADRLISRFCQGLVTRLDSPSYETRVAILHKKAQLRGIELPDDVAALIARRVSSNVRQLEGVLTKMQSLALLEETSITMDVARMAFGQARLSRPNVPTMQQILDVVTDQFGVRQAELQGKGRARTIVFPRQLCMYLARDLTNNSLEDIGIHLGCRNHTTVLHACRKIEQLRQEDSSVGSIVNDLEGKLASN